MGERSLTHRAEELTSPDAWILSKFEFDAFCTFTFTDPLPPLTVMYKCMMELVRRTAKQVYQVPNPNGYLYAFRYEVGEGTGRPHFHFLAGPYKHQPHTNKHTKAHQIKHIWEHEVKHTLKSNAYRPCCGYADCRAYDSRESGAEYICKPVLSARDFYEMQKFNDGFERHAEDDGSRVSLGSRLLLEIAKHRNKSNKVPGFARLLRTLKQRNVGAKSTAHKTTKYQVLPDQTTLVHPGDDTALRLYC